MGQKFKLIIPGELNVSAKNTWVGLLMLFWLGTAFSQEAVLRLRCEGESEGANVYINGHLKGQCPTDLGLPEGNIRLQVVKNLDKGRFRTFEKEFFVASGSVKRFEVVLGPVQLTEEGRKIEAARIEAEKFAAAQEAQRQAAAREAARIQAEKDAPRLAAEKARAEKEAAAQREAARRAEPGMVKKYMDALSSKGENAGPLTATLFTTYAPVFLPTSTTSDLIDGKNIAMTDPAVFGNRDSMIAQSMQLQLHRQKSAASTELAQR
jgi:hypothetical protein